MQEVYEAMSLSQCTVSTVESLVRCPGNGGCENPACRKNRTKSRPSRDRIRYLRLRQCQVKDLIVLLHKVRLQPLLDVLRRERENDDEY